RVPGNGSHTRCLLLHLCRCIGCFGSPSLHRGSLAGPSPGRIFPNIDLPLRSCCYAIYLFPWTAWQLGRHGLHAGRQPAVASTAVSNWDLGSDIPHRLVCSRCQSGTRSSADLAPAHGFCTGLPDGQFCRGSASCLLSSVVADSAGRFALSSSTTA